MAELHEFCKLKISIAKERYTLMKGQKINSPGYRCWRQSLDSTSAAAVTLLLLFFSFPRGPSHSQIEQQSRRPPSKRSSSSSHDPPHRQCNHRSELLQSRVRSRAKIPENCLIVIIYGLQHYLPGTSCEPELRMRIVFH